MLAYLTISLLSICTTVARGLPQDVGTESNDVSVDSFCQTYLTNSAADMSLDARRGRVTCYENTPAILLNSHDCFIATQKFWFRSTSGTFRRDSGNGTFSLPKTMTYGECSVKIDLIGTSPTFGSYNYFIRKMCGILHQCRDDLAQYHTEGGYQEVGHEGRFKIWVGHVGQLVEALENQTMTTVTA